MSATADAGAQRNQSGEADKRDTFGGEYTLDLNLLLCLQLLMQERSVTKAAKRINVTPSAVSKSLAKLRAWFDDPLFVNSPLGLSPTPLMVSMEQNLAEWMQMSKVKSVV